MDQQTAQRFTYQHNITIQDNKTASVFLNQWTKTTKARFGMKLYKFTPKKQTEKNHSIEHLISDHATQLIKEAQIQQKEFKIDLATPIKEKQTKEKKLRSTHAKDDSDSESYHPSKRTKIEKKKREKARKKEERGRDETSKKVLFDGLGTQ